MYKSEMIDQDTWNDWYTQICSFHNQWTIEIISV